MAENIFEHDDGIVDQARKGQRESTQHHSVHGAATSADGKKRGKSGKRDGKKDRESRTHASEKEQNHQAGQHQADGALAEQIGDSSFDEERLVKHNASDELLGNVNKVL